MSTDFDQVGLLGTAGPEDSVMASPESREAQLASMLASLPQADLTDEQEAPVSVTPIESATSAVPSDFQLTEAGLFAVDKDDKEKVEYISGALKIVAVTRNADSDGWGRSLEWQDPDKKPHRWNMPNSLLAGAASEISGRLLDGGLHLAPGTRSERSLLKYIANANPKIRLHAVDRSGWHEVGGKPCFVLRNRTLTADGKPEVFLQTKGVATHPPVAQSGTLEDWRKGVAIYALNNSRLAFSISIALSGPLMALVSAEGGGFHLQGPSSVGKSTALRAAASVFYGGGLRGALGTWRATDNSHEANAVAHCDLPMTLDEMGEADPFFVGRIAYMLANGKGKGRANADGSGRPSVEWRTTFLSSGEVGLNEVISGARAGDNTVRAGQQVRIVDFPAKVGALGLFETCHDFETPKQLAEHLSDATMRYYGTAGMALLRYLVAHRDAVAVVAKDLIKSFVEAEVPIGADGQVWRVANRFGSVAAAGEIATRIGILPWPVGEATRAAATCFADWRANRAGGDGSSEEAQGLAKVRGFLAQYGDSRFTPILPDLAEGAAQQTDQPEAVTRAAIQRAGYKYWEKGAWVYLIYPEVWRTDVCAGLNGPDVARSLAEKGHLIRGDGNNLAAKHRVPGGGSKTRFYTIRSSIFEE
jgi:putative DNA primase/helicase